MKKLFNIAVLVTVLVASGLVLAAGKGPTRSSVTHKRMQNQEKRIHQGVRSGELTKGEAKQLRHDEKNIRQDIKKDKSDGKFTKQERKEIKQEMNAESKKIHQMKHNEVERPKAETNRKRR